MKSPILIAAAVTLTSRACPRRKPGRGIKVTRTCDKVKHPHCHS